ncbi:MAG: tetratricopeptide repeat protein [Myxococcales bacterium]
MPAEAFSHRARSADQPPPADFGAGRPWRLGRPARLNWWLALLLLTGTVLAYLPVWHAGLIWDDRSFIMDNPLMRRADGLWRFWFSRKPVDYYPLTSTIWWIEWRLWGENPLGYHLVNVLLHGLNAVSLWRLLARLKLPGSWLAAAIFAVHPVAVESVAWIAEGKNVLAMLFYLASLSCFARFCSSATATVVPSPSAGTPSWRWYGLALLCFLLALLGKTVVAPMPFILLWLIWWERGAVNRRDVLLLLPFFALSVAIGLVSFWFQAHRAIGADIVRTDGFWARLAGAGWAIWFYAYKVLLPLGLRSIYPRWQVDAGAWWSYLPALLVAAAFGAFWRARRSWGKGPLSALFYFVVMLSPVLGFMDIGFMRFSLVADHWQYFAMVGPLVLIAGGVALRYQRLGLQGRRAFAAVVSVLLIGLTVLTWRQSELYRDAGTFWSAVLATNPDSSEAHNNLGGFLLEQGQSDEALTHFARAVELSPRNAKAQYNLGAALREKADVHLDEAIFHLQAAVEIRPAYVEAHNKLARALAQKRDWKGAMDHLERSLAIDPEQAEAHNNVANILWQTGRLAEAAAEYEKALALHPDYAAAHFNLAEVLRAQGETRQTVAHYRSALEARPDFAPALERLAWILATSPDAATRDGAQAVALASRADQISGGKDPEIVGTLAAAQAEAGMFREAIATAERASRLAVARGKAAMSERLRAQSALYQSGMPYHTEK